MAFLESKDMPDSHTITLIQYMYEMADGGALFHHVPPCRCGWPPTNTFGVCLIMNFTQGVRIGDDWDDRQPSLSTTLLVEVLPTLNILCAQSENEYNTS